jgi:hypothetical protein
LNSVTAYRRSAVPFRSAGLQLTEALPLAGVATMFVGANG